MARQRTSAFEDVIVVVGKLPWWAGLSLGLVTYLVLQCNCFPPANPSCRSATDG